MALSIEFEESFFCDSLPRNLECPKGSAYYFSVNSSFPLDSTFWGFDDY
jgi:hypothetical protein